MTRTLMTAAVFAVAGTASATDLQSMLPTRAEVWVTDAPVFENNPTFDTWDSSAGAYSAETAGPAPAVVTAYEAAMPTVPAGLGGKVGKVSYKGNGLTVISTNIHCDEFIIENHRSLYIQGAVTIYAEDVFKLENNTRIDLADGASLTVYIGGVGKIQNHSYVNTTGWDPTRVTFVNLSGTGFEVSNNVQVCASIISPGAPVMLANNADVYGWFTGAGMFLPNHCGYHVPGDAPKSIAMPQQTAIYD